MKNKIIISTICELVGETQIETLYVRRKKIVIYNKSECIEALKTRLRDIRLECNLYFVYPWTFIHISRNNKTEKGKK